LLVDAGLQDRDRMYEGLKKCLDEGVTGFALRVILSNSLDPLADDPRVRELLDRFRIIRPLPRSQGAVIDSVNESKKHRRAPFPSS